MDYRVEALLNPTRVRSASVSEVASLAATLIAEHAYRAARSLLIDYSKAFTETPELAILLAKALCEDHTLSLVPRYHTALTTLAPHSSDATAAMFRLELLLKYAEHTDTPENWLEFASELFETRPESVATSWLQTSSDALYAHDRYLLSLSNYDRLPRARPLFDPLLAQRAACLAKLRLLWNDRAAADLPPPFSLVLPWYLEVGDSLSSHSFPSPVTRTDIAWVLARLRAAFLSNALRRGQEPIPESFTQVEQDCLLRLADLAAPGAGPSYLASVFTATRLGRVGLALSGGGLRAAFFHIGVLARLADEHLLPHVSVISTVSGGTLVGALYTLELRKLAATADRPLTVDQYRQPVEHVLDLLTEVAARNLRMRTFAHPHHVLTAILRGRHHRTRRFAHVLEDLLFRRYRSSTQSVVPLSHLAPPAQEVRDDRNAIPEVILNATSITDGQRFAFTGDWMGVLSADNSYPIVVERKLLDELPLSVAVAASCCVPGLFDPLQLGRLLPPSVLERLSDAMTRVEDNTAVFQNSPDRPARTFEVLRMTRDTEELFAAARLLSVQLVDGGVYDNLGAQALLQADCTTVVCSDASAPFETLGIEAGSMRAAMRTNAIFMQRIRDLIAANVGVSSGGSPGSRRTCFIELANPSETTQSAGDGSEGHSSLFAALHRVRTDLDCFTEIEAMALAAAGYIRAREALSSSQLSLERVRRSDTLPSADSPNSTRWRFEQLTERLLRIGSLDRGDRRLARHLRIARFRFARPLLLSPWHGLAFVFLTAFALIGLLTEHRVKRGYAALANVLLMSAAAVSDAASSTWLTPILLVAVMVLLLVGYFLSAQLILTTALAWLARPTDAVRASIQVVTRSVLLILSALATPLGWVQIGILDRLLIRSGRLSEVLTSNRLSSTERVAAACAVAALIGFALLTGVEVYGRYQIDSDGRPRLGIEAWSVKSCERYMPHLFSRQIPGQRWEVPVPGAAMALYCRRPWNAEALRVALSSVPDVPARRDWGRRWPLPRLAPSAESLLRNSGASDFVDFLDLARRLRKVALEDAGLSRAQLRATYPGIRWDLDLSATKSIALPISLSWTGAAVELLVPAARSFTVADMADWLVLLEMNQPGAYDLVLSSRDLVEVGHIATRLAGSDIRDGSKIASNGSQGERTRRALQIIAVPGLLPRVCSPREFVGRVILCPSEDRIFLYGTSGVTDDREPLLVTEDTQEVIVRMARVSKKRQSQ